MSVSATVAGATLVLQNTGQFKQPKKDPLCPKVKSHNFPLGMFFAWQNISETNVSGTEMLGEPDPVTGERHWHRVSWIYICGGILMCLYRLPFAIKIRLRKPN